MKNSPNFNLAVAYIFMALSVVPLYWMLTLEVRDFRNSVLFWSAYGIASLYQTEMRVWARFHICFLFMMVALIGTAIR